MAYGGMAKPPVLQPEAADVFQRMGELNLRNKDLADALGIGEDKVSKMRSGARQFQAAEILKATNWLANRKGRPLVQGTIGSAASVSEHRPTFDASGGDTVEIIQLDLAFSMGPGTTIDDYIEETPVRFDLGFLRQITRSPPERLRLAKGLGDSMFPTLLSSDRVMIDTTQRMLNLNDRIYAISLYGAAAIKRLRTVGHGQVKVISDNKDVPDQDVDADDLVIAGRIIWFGRDL